MRQLKTFDNNTFSYDGFGKRCRKNSIYYLYDGNQLIKERRNGTSLVYFYDTTGICGFRYNIFTGGVNSTDYYFYRKNLQGDVTAILDQNGNVVAEYLYDAWGKCTITYDPTGIGAINSIRYRSYYYDTETGLYYLKSRYYDPNTGRFLNPDKYVFVGPITIGCNTYAYCFNNPVNKSDYSGHFSLDVTHSVGSVTYTGEQSYYTMLGKITVSVGFESKVFDIELSDFEFDVNNEEISLTFSNGQTITFDYEISNNELVPIPNSISSTLYEKNGFNLDFDIKSGFGFTTSISTPDGTFTGSISISFTPRIYKSLITITNPVSMNCGWMWSLAASKLSLAGKVGGGSGLRMAAIGLYFE